MSIPAPALVSGGKNVLFFLIQGGHLSHGKFCHLLLVRKEEMTEPALSASDVSQVCSAQNNQHAEEVHCGWHNLNLFTSIIQEVLYLHLVAKPPRQSLSDWVGSFVKTLQWGMKIPAGLQHMHRPFQQPCRAVSCGS